MSHKAIAVEGGIEYLDAYRQQTEAEMVEEHFATRQEAVEFAFELVDSLARDELEHVSLLLTHRDKSTVSVRLSVVE